VPRITNFCIRIYVFGCRSSLFRLCDSDFGITPVDDITIRITCTVFCFHIAHISFTISWYLLCLSVIVFARLCVFGTAMCVRDSCVCSGQLCVFGTAMCVRDSYVYQISGLCFFIRESYVRSVSRYCFIRNHAAIPVQLAVVVLQYISWCIPIVGTFVFNQFSGLLLLLLLLLLTASVV
jgi:hypothetical protein